MLWREGICDCYATVKLCCSWLDSNKWLPELVFSFKTITVENETTWPFVNFCCGNVVPISVVLFLSSWPPTSNFTGFSSVSWPIWPARLVILKVCSDILMFCFLSLLLNIMKLCGGELLVFCQTFLYMFGLRSLLVSAHAPLCQSFPKTYFYIFIFSLFPAWRLSLKPGSSRGGEIAWRPLWWGATDKLLKILRSPTNHAVSVITCLLIY